MNSEERERFNRYWRKKAAYYHRYFQDRLEVYFLLFDPELLQRNPRVKDWGMDIVRFTFQDSNEIYSLTKEAIWFAVEVKELGIR